MTKSKEPSFPFYSQDFLTGCAGLSWPDIGKYSFLLAHQHQKGHLSEKIIKRIIGRFSPELRLKFVQDNEGLFYNERLESELNKRKRFKEKQSENSNLRFSKTLPTVLPKDFQDNSNGTSKTLPLEDEYISILKELRSIIPPSKTVVSLYCRVRKNGIDADYFVEYYTARGWVYGKQKTAIVDWQAVVRTWEKRNKDNAPGRVNLTQLENERRNHLS
jgi:hypothetical protein